MAKQKRSTFGDPPAAKRLKNDELAALCAEWSDLDEQRLELQRQAKNKADAQESIERRLIEQLHLKKRTEQKLGADYEFGFELVPGTLYYKSTLIQLLGQEEFDRRQAAVPRQNRFYLHDKRPKPPEPTEPRKPRGRKTA